MLCPVCEAPEFCHTAYDRWLCAQKEKKCRFTAWVGLTLLGLGLLGFVGQLVTIADKQSLFWGPYGWVTLPLVLVGGATATYPNSRRKFKR